MAKLGKLTKLKSAIKRWPSLTKLSRNNSSVSATCTDSSAHNNKGGTASNEKEQHGLYAVYVGKSRRRYLVNSNTIDHPVFQELVDKSCSYSDGVVVSCEVVLFEHFLWMLESNDTQMGSMDEIVEFYNCAC
ncbi:hypothetical protein Lal_00030483 [Lupinus albus]|uniref:Putative small auxin-up RNA n=1 Tax=Lupinus albus TaxID=3870 RepID=A0A6A5LNK0_LUPAL|nr:putative small auxin-up RNA [Lupinus albus]KAF1863451.1 hypothetical protein Lal_00030483 [Lupinus albus]